MWSRDSFDIRTFLLRTREEKKKERRNASQRCNIADFFAASIVHLHDLVPNEKRRDKKVAKSTHFRIRCRRTSSLFGYDLNFFNLERENARHAYAISIRNGEEAFPRINEIANFINSKRSFLGRAVTTKRHTIQKADLFLAERKRRTIDNGANDNARDFTSLYFV